MLRIIVEETRPGVWNAKATLSGRGISQTCMDWEGGRTKEEALKKLKTKLTKELKISLAACYRMKACLEMIP